MAVASVNVSAAAAALACVLSVVRADGGVCDDAAVDRAVLSGGARSRVRRDRVVSSSWNARYRAARSGVEGQDLPVGAGSAEYRAPGCGACHVAGDHSQQRRGAGVCHLDT